MSGEDPEPGRVGGVLGDGASRLHGEEARAANVAAGRALADTVRTTLGPRGLDKMVVGGEGRVTITNDGVTILRELEVVNATAEMIVEVAEAQENEVGDGTTTAVVLAGALLAQAEDLLERGLHPTTIVDGYRIAGEYGIDETSAFAEPVARAGDALLRRVAETSLAGTRTGPNRERIAGLVVEAARRSADRGGVDRDRVHVVTRTGTDESRVLDGIVVRKHPVVDGAPGRLDAASVLVVNEPLELRFDRNEELGEDVTARVDEPETRARLAELEDERLAGLVDRVVDLGADAVFCSEGIDDAVGYALARAGAFAIEFVADRDVSRIPEATGATVTDLESASPSDLGAADLDYREAVEATILEHPGSPHVTLLHRDPGLAHRKEFERTVDDAVDVVARTLLDGRVVPGGGAVEAGLAAAVREFATGVAGREQLAVEAFGEALEVVPRTLAATAGLDPIDALVALRAAHAAGRSATGIDAESGAVGNVRERGILEPASAKTQALGSAVEAANRVLRIDQVVSAGDLEIDPGLDAPP